MKKLRCAAALLCCLVTVFLGTLTSYAEEFTEEDRLILGIFPIWCFLLILAGAAMIAVIVIIEVTKRKRK